MLPTAHAYSSFAAKDIAAEKEFYAKKLGLDVNELYDGQLLELRLGDDKRVLVYSKEDFRPATYTVLNFPVPDVDAAVAELQQNGVEMARFDGFDQDAKGIARPTSAGGGRRSPGSVTPTATSWRSTATSRLRPDRRRVGFDDVLPSPGT
jgi:catechol 2,3-dioxygenase-like lactoylglutathione lyase family enzyme